MKVKNVHQLRVSYTTDDDGIHVICSCGWEKILGHDPAVEDVVAAKRDHLGEEKILVDPIDTPVD